MFLIKLLQVNAFFVLLSIVSIIWNTSIQHKKVYMFNPISTMGNNTLFCHEDSYVCAKLISALMKTDVLGGGLIVLLHTLPLTLQGGSITAHNKHPVFGRKSQEVNVYYWTFIRGGWTSRN